MKWFRIEPQTIDINGIRYKEGDWLIKPFGTKDWRICEVCGWPGLIGGITLYPQERFSKTFKSEKAALAYWKKRKEHESRQPITLES